MRSRPAPAWPLLWCARRAIAVLFLACFGFPLVASAQTNTGGAVRGIIRDQQGGVLAGVVVTATSPSALGPHTATTDSNGLYRLVNLPPGEYTVTTEVEGFAPVSREHVIVRAGLNIGLDLVLPLGGVSDAIRVTSDSPLLETKSPGSTVNISGELERSVPITTRRNWADFLMLTPGVVSVETARPTYLLHGANANSTVVQVDGVDMASAQQSSIFYTNFNTDALQDIQVKTGAVDAASPLGIGAVFNVVTRSGTNAFSGASGLDFQGKSWRGNNNPGGTTTGFSVFQVDLSAGGPVARNRWWYFVAYREARTTSGISRSPDQVAQLKSLIPGFQPFDAEQRGHFWFGKSTTQLSPNHQLFVFSEYDRTPADSAGPTSAAAFSRSFIGGAAYAAGLSSVFGKHLTTRAQASYNDKTFYATALGSGPSRIVYQTTSLSSGKLVGSGAIANLDNDQSSQNVPYHKSTVTFDATYIPPEKLGTHELQGGVFVQFLHSENNINYVNQGFTLQEDVLSDPRNPAAGTVPFHRTIYDTNHITSVLADSHDVALYIQDAWKPLTRLTVSAGLRADFVVRTDKLFNLRTEDSAQIGPRVGVNYTITSDQRNVVRASWGRVHDALTTNLASVGTNSPGFQDQYDLNHDGVFETTFVTPGANARFANRVFDPKYRQPRVDEFSAGYRRQLPSEISVDVGFTRRAFRNQTAFVDTNGIYENGVFQGYRNVSQNEIYLVTNNQWNWPIYSGLTLQAAKQASRLQLIASYTRQWRHLEGTWQPNDPASFIQPAAFANDRGLGDVTVSSTTSANSLSAGLPSGGGLQWRDHNVRIGAAFQAPWNLLLAANYVGESGLWSGPIFTRVAAADPSFGPPTLTLSNGRLVSNPLGTVFRFAYPTRSDGQFTSPTLHIFNLRVGRKFSIAHTQLETALDIFNVTNHDADQQLLTSGMNQIFSANYGKSSDRQYPRAAQLALRWRF